MYWKIFTLSYLLLTGGIMLYDYARSDFIWGTIQMCVFALASYWFYRIWIKGKTTLSGR